MRTLLSDSKHDFNLIDSSTTIFFNNEKHKDDVVQFLKDNKFLVVDSSYVSGNMTVKEFLSANKFKMSLIPYFDVKRIISSKLNQVSFEDYIYIKTIILISFPINCIVFDDVLSFLSINKKKKIIKYLKDNKITFYNFTSNAEECLFTPYMVVINNDKVAMEGATKNVLLEEKTLKKLGFCLPFAVDLSLQLQSYGLVNNIYYDVNKLAEDLWNQ